MNEEIQNRNLSTAVVKEISMASSRPSWQSSNEGVHERVNFDDTIWGFELAGGSYYDTPLRITKVKPDSRADKAGIKVGDVLQTINGINTHMLTIQEAHDMVLKSGIEIKLELYAPDVEGTVHTVYQDDIQDEIIQNKSRNCFVAPAFELQYKGAKTNKLWSEIWPCNRKRDILYKESNCFLVPSIFVKNHPEQLLKKPNKK
ncbi:hypothetical protein ACJJTC_013392 [Scirpophaga incertulas]